MSNVTPDLINKAFLAIVSTASTHPARHFINSQAPVKSFPNHQHAESLWVMHALF